MGRASSIGWRPLSPLRGVLTAFPIALFSAAAATDWAYLSTEEIQWSNFSAWLNAGALVFGGLVLLWALIVLVARWSAASRGRSLAAFAILAAMCLLGLVNAFQHSRDGWSSVGAIGLTLSILTALLALAAGWIEYARPAGDEGER